MLAVGFMLASWLVLAAGEIPRGGAPMSFSLKSPDFTEGATIPPQFTCSGRDISPALQWSGASADTKSFALIADDPDAPAGTWVHWVLYNLPANVHSLPQNFPKSEKEQEGSLQGRNDFGKIGYGGPCPPPGKAHRYFFKLYALNAHLDLKPGASKKELERAMNSHILGQAETMGRFSR
jgi:Raf kinase inhibitor-like YbhB/YbcL family protein